MGLYHRNNGCVEQMPTVSRSDCTQVDLTETIRITYEPEAATPLQGIPLVGEDIILTGKLAEVVWKFLYLDMQISNRNKLQVGFDWTKQIIFGRDTSRF